jgi:cellulose synthase/poly-beta-1,6-N-acetylglucosamine synthase-like glycosyltransferase/peptidoglycan/xylan/chitin deacetylase (PgdA/CDA1 family)
MTSSTPPPAIADIAGDEDMHPVCQVFLDPTEVRWTRLRSLLVFLILALSAITFLFASSLSHRRAPSASPSRRAGLDAASARAASLAYIPDVPQVPLDVAARREGAEVWGHGAPLVSRRIAWVDPLDDQALSALDRHGRELTDVVLEGLSVDELGEIRGDIPLSAIDNAHAHGIRVLVAIDDASDDAWQAAAVTAMARDPERRDAFSEEVARRVSDLAADGVVLEVGEDDADDPDGEAREALLGAVRGLSPPHTFALAVGGDFEPRVLAREAAAADLVLLRAHRDADDHLPAGPPAPHDWLDVTLGAACALVPPDKIVPMLPTRAATWTLASGDDGLPASARSATWAEVMTKAAMAALSPRWVAALGSALVVLPGADGIERSADLSLPLTGDSGSSAWLAWLPDGASFADGMALARARGITGVGIDELGGEDPRIWQLIASVGRGPALVRGALAESPPPDSWQVLGEGVEMRVRAEMHAGRAAVSLTADGTVASERFEELPTQVTIERRAPAPPRTVAFTFDDGPDPDSTPAVLSILARHAVKATFFLVGTRVEREPELVQRLVAEGHEIGNHSFSHPDFGLVPEHTADIEIRATNLLLTSTTGRSTLLFRPPFRADDTPQTPEDLAGIEAAMRDGMTVIASTIDPRDWERPGADAIVDRVLSQAQRDGAGVVLLHDGGGDRSQTVQALEPILSGLEARGFGFVQVHDLLGSRDIARTNPPVPTLLEMRANQAVWWTGIWFLRILRTVALLALVLVSLRFVSMGGLSLLYGIVNRRRRASAPTEEQEDNSDRKASVVIPAYNEARVIHRTIESVLASRAVEVEVIVIDDGSTDGTAEVVRDRFGQDARVRCVRVSNGGKARALNCGFRSASHEIVVALDADTLFLPDTVRHLVDAMRNPEVAAVAGRAVVGNAHGFIGRCQALEYVTGQAIERRAWAVLGVVSVVPGAVGAWRRDAVRMAGGFGRDTLAEDSDLTIGLQVAGWRVDYAPDAVALTEAPEKVSALLKQRFRWTFGVLQTLWKHRLAFVRFSRGRPMMGLLLLPTVVTCHLAVPLFAPLVDLAALAAIYLGFARELLPYVVAMFTAELLLMLLAMVIDRASPRIAWDWIVQRVTYRWILFFALVRALLAAFRGSAVGWNKLARTGSVRVAPRALA